MLMEGVFYNGNGGYRKPWEMIYHIEYQCPEVKKNKSQMEYEKDVTQLKLCSSCQRIGAEQQGYYGQV
jgi:hypothetical protein